MATKKLKNVEANGWPKINQGSHLTVKTFEDGSTELIWDDEALMRDVQEAIASVASAEIPVKKTRKKKTTV
jgi:type IV secretory pathway VirD2 relaxase